MSMDGKLKCDKCPKMAVWLYMPSDSGGRYCDECVPRGCTCDGPDEPCCEFWYDENGFEEE